MRKLKFETAYRKAVLLANNKAIAEGKKLTATDVLVQFFRVLQTVATPMEMAFLKQEAEDWGVKYACLRVYLKLFNTTEF